jgi:cellulose synthase/poly-beta-1,6-N-acetylglucosamine synthase-like glycosyltransferase
MLDMTKFIFWLSIFFIAYGYIGYPLLIWLLGRVMPKPVKKGPCEPAVTILIPAYNEERVIRDKIENCLHLDYPSQRREIVIASDGSRDATCQIVKEFLSRGVVLLEYPEHHGKFKLLNLSVPKTHGEILVFSDASGMLNREALREVVSNFNDPEVGCVCGRYRMIPEDESLGSKGYHTYLEYDIGIKISESRFRTIIGAHGAFYAIRRELFEPIPEHLINDDFYIPMRVVAKGYRAVYEDRAVVSDRMRYTLHEEVRRRVRIGFGNWQQILELKSLLRPSRGMVAWQFFSHKVLRTLMPFFLITAFILSFVLHGVIYRAFFLFFALMTLLAIVGAALRLLGVNLGRPLSLPLFLVAGNIAYFAGTVKFFLGRKGVKW